MHSRISDARRRRAARPAGRSRLRGLTLVEALVGIALLSIVLAIAAPDFQQFGRSTRVAAQTAELRSALVYARSESMRRGVRVVVCRTADPTASTPACDDAAAWSDGWLVFVDNAHLAGNAAGVIDGADQPIRIGEPVPNTEATEDGTFGPWVSFSPQGLVRTAAGPAAGSLLLCQSPHGRRLSLNAVGLLSVVEEAC
jgi:type IV fimbrial biogenesis protein FimT